METLREKQFLEIVSYNLWDLYAIEKLFKPVEKVFEWLIIFPLCHFIHHITQNNFTPPPTADKSAPLRLPMSCFSSTTAQYWD